MPTERRDLLIFGAVGLAAAAAGAILGPLALQSQSGAPELLSASFPDLAGKERRILEFQHRALVANFWATWCEPCRDEVPLLVATYEKFRAAGGLILGIGIDSAEKLKRFAGQYRVSYPVLIGDGNALELMRKLGNRAGALPFTVVLDAHGSLAYRKLGVLRKDELETVLSRLLG
jgi:thiol-disulfide isomerase/thioredoxin